MCFLADSVLRVVVKAVHGQENSKCLMMGKTLVCEDDHRHTLLTNDFLIYKERVVKFFTRFLRMEYNTKLKILYKCNPIQECTRCEV